MEINVSEREPKVVSKKNSTIDKLLVRLIIIN